MEPVESIRAILGGNVSVANKTKIINGQYIDLSVLLENSSVAESTDKQLVISNGELITREKTKSKIQAIEQWTDAFLIYISIYTAVHPDKSQQLLKYMHTMRLGAARNHGLGFKNYDEQFRIKKSMDPSSSWAVDYELWLLYMVNNTPTINTPTINQTAARGHNKCYDFNNKGYCKRQPCPYLHLCLKCGANHASCTCQVGLQRQMTISRPEGNFRFRPSGNYARFSQRGPPPFQTRPQIKPAARFMGTSQNTH